MLIDELKNIARNNGIVGAGGAGFPAYAKMTEKADTVILNCVECEPLLKLHRQLLATHTEEIIQMLDEVRESFGAKEAVIGIKSEYVTTIKAIEEVIGDFPNVRICALKAAYPMGDEVVLIYEATGRVIKPGGLPIDENVVVYNVETMYNLYRAVHLNIPVTNKLVSIVGEIDHPLTVRVPLGTTVKEAISLAGKITVEDPAYVMGGPMMGRLGTENTVITKTTNAIIILPKDHHVVVRMEKNLDIEKRRASSSCCQCRTCTDMCSRHALGHPIEPHKVMRAVANHDLSDAGIKVEKVEPAPVLEDRELRKLPVHRLAARLDLARYDKPAPFEDTTPVTKLVKIPMSQHIGAPATPVVSVGDQVAKGQLIGEPKDGLSVAIHCSIDGVVQKVTDREVVVKGK